MSDSLFDSDDYTSALTVRSLITERPALFSYPYSRADGAAVARPLFQGEDGGSIPTSALQLNIKPIDVPTARQLVALWHSTMPYISGKTGGLPYRDCYVAEYEDHWYAVAIWTGPVSRELNDGRRYELRRLAIAPPAPRNSASRMLRIMVADIRRRRPDINELISYQLATTHTGTIYRASGWTPRHTTTMREWNSTRPRPPAQQSEDKICWHREIARA